ncbi:MAG TPA: site-specific DNA-methyltransferase [Acidimicrobiia bacterium]|nr:site-specific DNA-methyltransferase [Acidimicrobiia bacterium]
MARRVLVSDARRYAVRTVEDARTRADEAVCGWGLHDVVRFGLPEIDDRYHVWRVPLVARASATKAGEVVLDARSGALDAARTTAVDTIRARLERPSTPRAPSSRAAIVRSPLVNTVLCGDSEATLATLPAGSVDLVFTSPPYFNARPDSGDYLDYDAYLEKMRRVLRECHRVLAEGRFLVLNTAPVLLRRARRSEASRRLAVPFDLHRVLVEEAFDFVDDIVWEKPEGAGWATGRGRRFAADRRPLQYKAVPVTEYVLVYRRHTDRLLDWNIRAHHDPAAVDRSRIADGYERTNVWRIPPTSRRDHPAVFPVALAERVIRYWSFEDDVVLDPFAGVGTVGAAAAGLGRRFVLSEVEPRYVRVMERELAPWLTTPPPPRTGAPRDGAATRS